MLIFEDRLGNHLYDLAQVCLALEFEFCGEAVGKVKHQFGIRNDFQKSGRLNAEILDVFVRHTGEQFSYADGLYVDGNDAFVGKDQLVTYGLETLKNGFSGNQEVPYHRVDFFPVRWVLTEIWNLC